MEASSSVKREAHVEERIFECTTASAVIRLVNDVKFFGDCSYEDLKFFYQHIKSLDLNGFGNKFAGKAIKRLNDEIKTADYVRKRLIVRCVKGCKGLERPEVLKRIVLMIEQLSSGTEDWHAYDASLAIAEILLELGRVTEEWEGPLPISLFEMKTGVMHKQKIFLISELLVKKSKELDFIDLSTVEQKHLVSLRKQRLFRLRNLEHMKRLVLSDKEQPVCSKLFPKTGAWFFGGKDDKEGAVFEQEIEQLSEKHKIFLVGKSKRPVAVERYNTLQFLGPFNWTDWPQDMVDFSCNEIRVPVMPRSKDDELNLWKIVQQGRIARNGELWTVVHNKRPLYDRIERVRTTWYKKASDYPIAVGLALDCPIVMNLTYNEGGNTLLGRTEKGEPCAIIGLDSVIATQAIIERDLGYKVNDEMLRDAFRIDYGIEHVWFVEQPGDFHLDMCMAFVAPGVIVLNDSLAAHERFTADFKLWGESEGLLEEEVSEMLEELGELAQHRAKFEDLAEEELAEHGLKVHRFPGRYFVKDKFRGGEVEVMNMFNFVTATTPSGKRLVVALGVIEDSKVSYKENFLKMLGLGEEGPDAVEFLSLEASQMLLERKGGLSCSIKTIE